MNTNYMREPCFLVNDTPSNGILIDALRGGYHYEEKTEGKPEDEEPFQDGYYENAIDPVRYAILNWMGMNPSFMQDMKKIASIDNPLPKLEVM